MLSFIRPAVLLLAAAAVAAAQPALTAIQDTLYRADGTRFTGTLFINWNSFQGGTGADIATSSLTLPIVNGVLRTALVPTTTASAGAQYRIRYNSRGINDFTEIWAVPPSSVPLRVRDVRVSQGAIVGPPPVISPVQIPDVVGLQNELAIRPMKGVGFGVSRAAIINQAGQLDAAAGNLNDCIRVDGSSGPCGGGSSGVLPNFVEQIPVGTINGANSVFTLTFSPAPTSSLAIFRNGVRLVSGADYQLTGSIVAFFSVAIPQVGDSLVATYRFGTPNNPLGTLATSQVVCSSPGTSTMAIISTRLGTCTLSAGLLGTGDRLEIEFQYSHGGAASGFTGEVRIGTTSVSLRATAASETLLTGNVSFGIASVGQVWNTQSWGSALSLATSAGQSTEDITQDLTVDFRGLIASGNSDSVTLRNFTVVRHPAQANP